jgi:hypothetical protein
MKFLDKVAELGLLNEQDEVPTPEAPAAEEVVTPLSPVIKPDANDITAIEEFEDINENNAKQALQRLIQIMNSYTSEIDIDV